MTQPQQRQFFTRPRFVGVMGTELLGAVPDWFPERLAYGEEIKKNNLFQPSFLDCAYFGSSKNDAASGSNRGTWRKNPIQPFLRMVGRSYLNMHYANNWDRPTWFFRYPHLIPFTGHRFISFLSSLDYGRCMPYKLYTMIYKQFYPEFLKLPWTFMPGRIVWNKRQRSHPPQISVLSSMRETHAMLKDKQFRRFLNNNKICRGTTTTRFRHVKELYYIHRWLLTYAPILHPASLKVIQ